MAGVKLQKFLGKAPRIAPELLPDTAAQRATNVKLSSGDLIPYPQPVVADNHGLTDVPPRTLHALYSPAGTPVWLVWPTDVDIVTPAGTEDIRIQRFYYSGDGAPKVSTYALATTGAQPYPVDYYDLGLPLPTQKPTTVATAFTTKTTATYTRDAGGLVTMTTATAHGLKTGAFVTISGFTNVSGTYSQTGTTITVTITNHRLVVGSKVLLRFTSGAATANIFTVATTPTANTFTVTASVAATTSGNVGWDISNLNATSIKITVLDATTFTYTSPGFQVSTKSSAAGRVNLAGDTQARSYLYTWFTPWEEESIGSEPSDELFIKEGQLVTVSNLPTARPAGKNYIRGIRLYRTLSTVADTEYLRLATLWFPVTVSNVTGTTVTTAEPHNLTVGSYFKISTGVSGGEVTDVIDDFRFTYTGGVGSGGTGGTLYHDVSENPGTTTPRYWGDGSYDFTDDFNVASLLNALVTDDYDPPPAGLRGLTLYNNNILVGFVGNEIYFSEPGQFHAWPRVYKRDVPHNIIGLAVFSGYLLVATDSYPYLIQGGDPATLNLMRVDAHYPCLNKRSIANMGFGVMYATHDGLALYSTTTGPQLATRLLYNSETWNADLDPRTLVGTAYKDTYLAWHASGGISFERDDHVGGFFVDLTTAQKPDATWYDPRTNKLYYAGWLDTAWTLARPLNVDSLFAPAPLVRPYGLTVRPEGTRMYLSNPIAGSGSVRAVYQYDILTPWDLSTATLSTVFTPPDIPGYGSVLPSEVIFQPGGAKAYIAEKKDDEVLEYTLSIPWDISTAVYSGVRVSLRPEVAELDGITFSPDGRYLFAVSSGSGPTRGVVSYRLTTPWDLSTTAYTSTRSIAADFPANPAPVAIRFSSDGVKMFVQSADVPPTVVEYNLSTPWDINTAIPVYTLPGDLGTAFGVMDFSPAGDRFFFGSLTILSGVFRIRGLGLLTPNQDVYLWDDPTQPAQPFEWKSKVIVTQNPINIGAAQVDADYAATSPVWDTVTDTWDTSTILWDSDGGVTFKLWVDGELVLTQELDSRRVFRLPRGYRSDTFEVGVEGSVRLRAIRIAETPTGLREV